MKLKINPLFFIILLIFSLCGFFQKVLVAFILVFLHEFSHLLAAKKLGFKIYKIELFPFGGVAEYLGMVEMNPSSEIIIALSGPFFNFFTAAVFFILPFDFDLINFIIEIINFFR